MSVFRGKVAAHAARGRQERFHAWLNQSENFKRDELLNLDNRNIIEDIFSGLNLGSGKKDQKLIDDLHILIENLLRQRDKAPIAIPMRPDEWPPLPRNYEPYASGRTLQLIYALEKQGMIGRQKGYQGYKAKGIKGRKTRIWPTSLLLDYFPATLQAHGRYDPGQLIILKDDDGRLLGYRDNETTIRIRKILTKANTVNAAHRIEYDGDRISAFLYAIFKGSLTRYGRMHTRGQRHYQGYSGSQRKEFTINDQSVIELDFSGLQPRLLYALDGIQFDKDPYSMILDDEKARPFLKHILLSLINATSDIKAESAANNWFRENPESGDELREIGITCARPLIDSFKKEHAPIAHYFCNSEKIGMKLMTLDAKIALDIIKHFAFQNKAILAVHDSFIVQACYEEELRESMLKSYSKHTKGFTCPIKGGQQCPGKPLRFRLQTATFDSEPLPGKLYGREASSPYIGQ
jgi:hypothetical protein